LVLLWVLLLGSHTRPAREWAMQWEQPSAHRWVQLWVHQSALRWVLMWVQWLVQQSVHL
jgi:hypothetical protein